MGQIAYKNLKNHRNTTAGIAEFFYIARVSDFVEGGIQVPELPVDGQNNGNSVQILTPHEFKDGKAFAKVLCAPEKNKLEGKSIGDTLFKKLDFVAEMFIPGSYAELHEQVAGYLNTPCIVLTKDSECAANMHYQLGNDCSYAYIDVDFTTETTKGNVKGYTVRITWQNSYVQLYSHQDGPEVLPD